MNRRKAIMAGAYFILFAAGAFFAFGVMAAPAAHAQTADGSAVCGVTPDDLAQIAAVQNDPTLSASDEIKKELAIRKALVGETISCAEQDAQELKAELASSTVPGDGAMQQLQSQLVGDVNQALSYYDSETARLDLVGIAGTKGIAQEVLQWRQGAYVPLAENADNFILWTQNQPLFDTAAARMAQTQHAVSFIESATPNSDLQTAFASAQADLMKAQSENQSARSALIQGFAPDQTLGDIKQSLDSLSATYRDFFTISTIISGILPQ